MLAALVAACAISAPRPNIVFILADDLGYGDLGCYGQKTIQTPNLDALAASGIKFTVHYSGSPVCASSRDCFMTGRDTGHCYMRGNGFVELRRDPHDITIAELLQKSGYRTGMICKSSVQCELPDATLPFDKGFDHYFGFLQHTAAHEYYPRVLWNDGAMQIYPANHGFTGAVYDDDLFLQDAKRFIDSPDPRPFFLFYSATLPHAALEVPEQWKKAYEGKFKETPFPGDEFYCPCPDPIATYAGMVSRFDYDCGEIIDELKSKGLDKNTVIFVSSDNGGMDEGGYHMTDLDSCGDLRGAKRDLYEGGIRVPLIVSWPGKIAAGQVTDHVSTLYDFLPTACDLAGVRPPRDIQGISYLPLLLNTGKVRDHPYLYWEFHEEGGKRAVRTGDWMAIQEDVGKDPGGPIELYNLNTDPGEKDDVSAQHPDIIAEARELFVSARTYSSDYDFTGNPGTIGYVRPAPPTEKK